MQTGWPTSCRGRGCGAERLQEARGIQSGLATSWPVLDSRSLQSEGGLPCRAQADRDCKDYRKTRRRTSEEKDIARNSIPEAQEAFDDGKQSNCILLNRSSMAFATLYEYLQQLPYSLT